MFRPAGDVALKAVTVGAVVSTYSYAPMSQCAPFGRAMPRWSRLLTREAAQVESSPASMAGEPASSAKVLVEPPLFASGPRFGSPLRAGEQEPSSIRLLVLVPMVASLVQSSLLLAKEAELFAMIVFARLVV